jgi:hypothetical protein
MIDSFKLFFCEATMSLQQAAQYLAAQGRGPDTMLVHMSRDEVLDLQKAARAYGGSLSINPETGLPEAGLFDELKKAGKAVLPLAAGAVLGPAGFGLSPMMAGLTAGGIRGLTSGSLEKGLAFGLGAYGGAGLAGGLANLGTGAISQAAGAGLGEEAAQQAISDQLAKSTITDKLSAGAKYAFNNPMDALKGIGGGSTIKGIGTLGAAFAPMLLAPQTTTPMPTSNGVRRQYYEFDPGRRQDPEAGYMGPRSGERTYFNPTFRRLPEPGMAQGGSTSQFGGNAYLNNIAQRVAPKTTLPPLEKPFESEEEYEYIYDPIAQKFIRAKKPKKQDAQDAGMAANQIALVDTGGGIGMGPDSGSTLGGFGHGMGDAGVGAIGLGQGLSGIGLSSLGNAISNFGIGQLGAAEAQAAADAATAASMGAVASDAASSSNTAGLSAAAAAAEMSAAMDAAAAEAAASGDLAGLNAGDVGAMSGPGDASAGDLGGMGAGDIGGGGGGDTSGGGADAGGSGDCVDPAVLIMLADGNYVPAGSIEVGDVLFAMHEKTLEFGAYPVEHSEEVQQPKALVLFDDGSNMLVSHSHKFFMVDGEWKQVYQLEPGDTVRAAPGANDKTVIGLEPQGEGPVMKITVKDAHTYISEGLISHNMKAKGGIVRRNMGGISSYAVGGISAYAGGGYNLGDYSDGGRLLRGPGDGVSDSIPAVIGQRRPARLADGEFVIPARIVSELGNGSTEAGARKLYAMMDRVQRARGKTTGKGRVAKNTRADKYLPA